MPDDMASNWYDLLASTPATFDTNLEKLIHFGNSGFVVLCLASVLSAATVCRAEDPEQPEKVLRHAVFFKFKDGTSDADIKKVVDAFDALPKKIDSIKGYQRGKQLSPIGYDDGFTHCW